MNIRMVRRGAVGRWVLYFILGALVIAMGARASWAQGSSSISGVVTDASGSAIPGATVTVKSMETGAARTVLADDSGNYRALSLDVGRYEVTVTKEGFKAFTKTGITLVVGQQAVVNVQLEVGGVSQSVTVTGEAELVNTTPASISGIVAEQQVKDLPLNGRSFDTLITLNPGTANTSSYRSSTSTGTGQGYNFVVSGNREDYNLFTLNGIEYTGVSTADVSPGGVSGQLLGVDAVREFNVLENTYGAEYGKRPGGQINVVTQSGTNTFHGSLFEFIRNSALDSHNFFDQPGTAKPQFQRNQFGGSGGAPLRRDKTFVFGNYEGFRQHLALSSRGVVPDDNARNGFLPCTAAPTFPCNTTTNLANVGVAPGVAPFFALWPQANGGEAGGGGAFLFSNPLQTIREDFGNLRADHNFSSKDTFSGAYTIDDGVSLTPSASNPLQQTSSILRSHVLSLQEVHVLSNSAVNTTRFGFSRPHWILNAAPAVNPPGLALISGNPVGSIQIGSAGLSGVGAIASAGSNGSQQYEVIARNLFTGTDDFQLTRGAHLITMGVWAQRIQSNDNAANQRNSLAQFTDLQHFLQGQSSNIVAVLNPKEVAWRQWAAAWYVQDAIRLRSNLTLSVGLRHEFNNGWNSPLNEASNFIFGSNGILGTQPVLSTSVYTKNNAKRLFGPRVGLAWSPFKKTAFHAGFGTYFDQMDYLGSCCDSSPIGSFNQGISIGLASPAVQNFPIPIAANAKGAKVAPAGVDPYLKMPTVEQWSARIEQGITTNLLLSVGYVGEHGFHLANTVDVNTVPPTPTANGAPGAAFPSGTPARANPVLSNSRYTLSNANSSYNALQVDVTKRVSKGLQFRGAYTFSKSLDIHSSSFLANSGVGSTTTVMVPQDPKRDWGPSSFNTTHQFAANFSYALPFGRGQAFGRNVTGLADKFVGGWQWNGIARVQSGFPFTPLVSFNRSNNGDSRAPDRVSLNPNFTGPVILGSPDGWFNTNAFVIPAAGTYGNAGRDILTGPGLGEFDMSLFKTTTISERFKAQFRAEFFNILNRPNFGLPSINTFTSAGAVAPSAGLISPPSATTQREIQFGLKVLW